MDIDTGSDMDIDIGSGMDIDVTVVVVRWRTLWSGASWFVVAIVPVGEIGALSTVLARPYSQV